VTQLLAEGGCEQALCLFICSRKVDKNRPHPLRARHTEDNISPQAQKQSGNEAELGVNIHTVQRGRTQLTAATMARVRIRINPGAVITAG
jgi:hypothetical protein